MRTSKHGLVGQKHNFDLIFDEVSRFLRSSENRTSRNAMAMFWIKLKTNLSFRQIGSLFNINGDSEKRRLCAAKAFDSVRNLLIKYFVPNHLGIKHMQIEDTKAHNTAYSKVSLSSFGYIRAKQNKHRLMKWLFFFDSSFYFLIFYVAVYFSFLVMNRRSSGTERIFLLEKVVLILSIVLLMEVKKRHYLKFMSIVHPDGFIVDIIGPFEGTLNDANITKEILETNNCLTTWLNGTGQLIVDRDFRDIIEVLQQLGYEVHMPAFLKKRRKTIFNSRYQLVKIMYKNSMVSQSIPWKIKKMANVR